MQYCGYARVSNREQQINSNALEQQVERLKRAGAEEVFIDVESGYKGRRREGLEKVMALVRSLQVEQVIITRIDRLSRKSKQAFALVEEFIQSGVVLRCLDEPIDLSTASGKMATGMLIILAQHHSDQKSEAVKHGWEHLRQRGVAMNPPFGYCKIDNRHHLDNASFCCLLDTKEEKSKAAIAREIIDAFLEKRTIRLALRVINERYGIQTFSHRSTFGGRIARDMFRFSVPGLSSWLQNPVLRGHNCYLRKRDGRRQKPQDWLIAHNTHPTQRLITDEEYRIIEDTITNNKQTRGYGSTRQKYPLSGLVFCGVCRGACYSCCANRGKTPGYNYYFQCKNWRTRGCSQKTMVRMEKIEDTVIQALITRAHEITAIANIPGELPESPKLRELRADLQAIENLTNPVFEKTRAELRSQIRQIEQSTYQDKAHHDDLTDILLENFSQPSVWQSLTTNTKTVVYRSLIDQVIVLNGEVNEVKLKV